MICPKCGFECTQVKCTITDIIVERYRRCVSCGYSFPTVELVKNDPLLLEYSNIQIDLMNKVKN